MSRAGVLLHGNSLILTVYHVRHLPGENCRISAWSTRFVPAVEWIIGYNRIQNPSHRRESCVLTVSPAPQTHTECPVTVM